jgi:signal recognition particle subunit SRP68
LSSTALAKANPQSASLSSDLKQLDILPLLIQSLHARIENLVNHHRGLVELHNLSENSRIAADKHLTSAAPIVERLNSYPPNGVDLKNLVTYPPQLKPVPVKPLFFDVAWNYIDYPGRTPELTNGDTGKARTEAAAQDEKKKGWFGWGSR